MKTSELITAIVPPPTKDMCWQRGSDAATIRKKAYADLEACGVGQHVLFYTTDRARVSGYCQSPRFLTRTFKVCKIHDSLYGAWRIR